jgi:hypothetical protein
LCLGLRGTFSRPDRSSAQQRGRHGSTSWRSYPGADRYVHLRRAPKAWGRTTARHWWYEWSPETLPNLRLLQDGGWFLPLCYQRRKELSLLSAQHPRTGFRVGIGAEGHRGGLGLDIFGEDTSSYGYGCEYGDRSTINNAAAASPAAECPPQRARELVIVLGR